MKNYRSFTDAIADTFTTMRQNSVKRSRGKWQGVDTANRPDMDVYEILHWGMIVWLYGKEDLALYRRQIQPNLPWADGHFEERVSGHPLNPGEQWKHWPWGTNADKFRADPAKYGDPGPDLVFDHTYMQRFWPKLAGKFPGGIIPDPNSNEYLNNSTNNRGIYFHYGDLGDVVEELAQDPTTRQAILPVFFPEDTGCRPGRRKPCSLAYNFILEDTRLDIVYYLRSCDLIRHFRDDLYLTLRLLLWMLNRLREKDKTFWTKVKPGRFVMLITNLHCFVNDYRELQEKKNGATD